MVVTNMGIFQLCKYLCKGHDGETDFPLITLISIYDEAITRTLRMICSFCPANLFQILWYSNDALIDAGNVLVIDRAELGDSLYYSLSITGKL